MLKLLETERTKRVSAEDLTDYQTFSENYQTNPPMKEIQIFERFYA
jgi:hypothetical protein